MMATVGRIVHYTAYNGKCLAAIVSDAIGDIPDSVHLAVFTSIPNVDGKYNGGVQFLFGIAYDGSGKPGTWHWPERIEP